MVSIPMKAVALALFFSFPLFAPASAQRVESAGRSVVVDDDEVFTVDRDDPVVVRVRSGGRAYIGVRLIEMTPDLRAHFGAPRDAGVLVGEVEPDSAAAKAGVAVGDVITTVDGEKVESSWQISRAVRRKNAGDTVKLDVSRDRAAKHLTVTVAECKHTDFATGTLRDEIREGILRDFGRRRPLVFEGSRLEEKLDRLEQRLNELEKKLRK